MSMLRAMAARIGTQTATRSDSLKQLRARQPPWNASRSRRGAFLCAIRGGTQYIVRPRLANGTSTGAGCERVCMQPTLLSRFRARCCDELEHWYGLLGTRVRRVQRTSVWTVCAGRERRFCPEHRSCWDEAKNMRTLDVAAQAIRWPVYVAGETQHPEGGRPVNTKRVRRSGNWRARTSPGISPAHRFMRYRRCTSRSVFPFWKRRSAAALWCWEIFRVCARSGEMPPYLCPHPITKLSQSPLIRLIARRATCDQLARRAWERAPDTYRTPDGPGLSRRVSTSTDSLHSSKGGQNSHACRDVLPFPPLRLESR